MQIYGERHRATVGEVKNCTQGRHYGRLTRQYTSLPCKCLCVLSTLIFQQRKRECGRALETHLKGRNPFKSHHSTNQIINVFAPRVLTKQRHLNLQANTLAVNERLLRDQTNHLCPCADPTAPGRARSSSGEEASSATRRRCGAQPSETVAGAPTITRNTGEGNGQFVSSREFPWQQSRDRCPEARLHVAHSGTRDNRSL